MVEFDNEDRIDSILFGDQLNINNAAPRVVVVTIDQSDHAMRAFNWYYDNVRREKDFVICVHVVEPLQIPLVSSSKPLAAPTKEISEKIKTRIAKINTLRERYEEKMRELEIEGEVLVEESKNNALGQKVCDIIRMRKAHSVVMGNRGMGTFRRTVLGSVSDFVVHNAGVPVTIVPPD